MGIKEGGSITELLIASVGESWTGDTTAGQKWLLSMETYRKQVEGSNILQRGQEAICTALEGTAESSR